MKKRELGLEGNYNGKVFLRMGHVVVVLHGH